MLFSCGKYLFLLKQKSTVIGGLLLLCAQTTNAQQNHLNVNNNSFHLNPMLRFNYKPPLKANQQFTAYIKPSKYELMYWPNFPLNAAQIEARDREYNRPIGEQIASDIIRNNVNNLISGKKKPIAIAPKF